MSIFPATDIITDVARAADPKRVDVAMRRLNEAGAARPDFANAVDKAAPRGLGAFAYPRPTTSVSAAGLETRPTPAPSPAAAAAQKFEAFILQTWLEAMLPKEDSGAFGHGTAGGVWRSMMAEHLGAQLAKSGAIGLDRILSKEFKTVVSRDISASAMQRG